MIKEIRCQKVRREIFMSQHAIIMLCPLYGMGSEILDL